MKHFDYTYEPCYNPQDAPTPSERFNVKPVGVITAKSPLDEKDTRYEVIGQNDVAYVVNTWYKYHKDIPQLVPKEFVINFQQY